MCAMCSQQMNPRAKVPLKWISRTKVPFFLEQHHALFQSWAEHWYARTKCSIMVYCILKKSLLHIRFISNAKIIIYIYWFSWQNLKFIFFNLGWLFMEWAYYDALSNPHCILWYSNIIGVNISERKSETDRTKKWSLYFFTARGTTGTVVHRLDATLILPELR